MASALLPVAKVFLISSQAFYTENNIIYCPKQDCWEWKEMLFILNIKTTWFTQYYSRLAIDTSPGTRALPCFCMSSPRGPRACLWILGWLVSEGHHQATNLLDTDCLTWGLCPLPSWLDFCCQQRENAALFQGEWVWPSPKTSAFYSEKIVQLPAVGQDCCYSNYLVKVQAVLK